MAAISMTQLICEKVSHQFGAVPILENINFSLSKGETLALVGQSGCGKTTLLRLCAQLVVPTAGSISTSFKRPAVVFQQPRLLPWKTVFDNIALVCHRADRQRINQLIMELGLTLEDAKKYPQQLSGGMQSRVALARALIINPDFLLLDEPFSALDIGLKSQLYRALTASRWRQVSKLLITHDLAEAIRLADKILVLKPNPGQIVDSITLERPVETRGEAYVYQTLSTMMTTNTIQEAFDIRAEQLVVE